MSAIHSVGVPERFPFTDSFEKGKCVYHWKVGELREKDALIHSAKDVYLVQKNKELQYQVYDKLTNKCSFGLIPLGNDLINEMINRLSTCVITSFNNGEPAFSDKYIERTVDNGTKKVRLFSYKSEEKKLLIWEFKDRKRNHMRLTFQSGTFLDWSQCTDELIQLFKDIVKDPDTSTEKRLRFFRKFTISKVEKVHELWKVHICPVFTPSRIDNTPVTFYTGTATLLSNGHGPCGNHAVILFEYLDQNYNYCMRTADFTGSALRSKFIDPKDLKYDGRSQIWRPAGDKIRTFFKDFDKKETPPFSILGSHAKLSSGKDNCLTWAEKQLNELGIKLESSQLAKFLSKVVSYTKGYTEKEEFYLYKPFDPRF